MADSRPLAADATAIWKAAVASVRSETLIEHRVHIEERDGVATLHCGLSPVALAPIQLSSFRRIVVVGAGKSCAGMAAGLEHALGDAWASRVGLTGWINVPDNCARPLSRLHLHPARPAGVNEPTQRAVAGTQEILKLVSQCHPDDLVICLLSGGGSALLPCPTDGITLDDKLAVTRFLSGAGADIHHLNTVRKQLSQVKGGQLLRVCHARRLVSLILSDVLGDPLDVIASGPTVPNSSTAGDALQVLRGFPGSESHVPAAVWQMLERAAATTPSASPTPGCAVENLIVGNNQMALDAAAAAAERLGYRTTVLPTVLREPAAEAIGGKLLDQAISMAHLAKQRWCLISGGEPTVQLVPSAQRGRGGRNQQLVLAAICRWLAQSPAGEAPPFVLMSGGTDGEDGPTDAAGAIFSATTLKRLNALGWDPEDYLRRNDAYPILDATGSLLRTGPTDTNVCDVRVIVGG
ncbi:MAG: DUF4147 domain-containing protein [Planctomycetales bacterium]|nr:DUF4147 domain-containing protein [Planctomycetales bacterium]